MNLNAKTRKPYRKLLITSVSATALFMFATVKPASAEQASEANIEVIPPAITATAQAASGATNPIVEHNRYFMRLMTQIFDGSKEFSHTQIAAFARKRQGDLSWTMMDFGDGAVVITEPKTLSVGGFKNTSKAELGVLYNYKTKSIEGKSELADFHNSYVRPHLDQAPGLGRDARWTSQVPVSSLGVESLSGQRINMEISREYFTYAGKEMVLLQYNIPALRFEIDGSTTVVHWGKGFALTDPGFGNIYASVALHRSVADTGNKTPRPYRYYRSAFASDDNGKMLFDLKKIPATAKIYNDYFDGTALQVIPYNDGTGKADQRPVKLAANIDVMALSIAENGANDGGMISNAQVNGNRGNEVISGPDALTNANQISSATSVAWNTIVPNSPQEKALFSYYVNELSTWKTEADNLANTLHSTAKQINQLQKQIEPTPALKYLETDMIAKGRRYEVAEANLQDVFHIYGPNNTSISSAEKQIIKNQALADYKRAKFENEFAIAVFEDELVKPSSYQYSTATSPLADELAAAQNKMIETVYESRAHEAKGKTIAYAIQDIPQTRYQAFKSGMSTGLKVLGDGFNGYTIGAGIANLGKQGGQNLASGQAPALTRTYGYALSGDQSGATFAGILDLGLAFDLIGLATSDPLTAAAVATGSYSDLLISGKALKDINVVNLEAAKLGTELARRQREQYTARSNRLEAEFRAEIAALDQGIADLDAYADDADQALQDRMDERGIEDPNNRDPDAPNPNIDPETGLPKPGYWQYLKDNYPGTLASYGIDPEAPVGGWPGGIGPEYRPGSGNAGNGGSTGQGPTDEELLAGLEDEINKQDYPTAPPRDPNQTGDGSGSSDEPMPPPTQLTPAQLEQIERVQRQQAAREELRKYQERKLQELKNREKEARGKDFTVSDLETSDLETSSFDVDIVSFISPEFDRDRDLFDEEGNLRKVGPDDFDMTDFDAPDISKIDWTNFDDDDYPNGDQIPAFTYENMEGIVATDLSPWEDWLATQDLRKLTQLALQAGYPNLASALTDAENIIRLSQDAGYRQWALQQPSCNGMNGCPGGPQGLWTMKMSLVALGDILVQSRGIFSTGGFSDIGISGFNLMYALRDHGIEDGDLIDVKVTQFGRTVVDLKSHFLRVAGTDFSARLGPGVAQMVVTALNEGSASPNTAEVTIQNVVRGDERQTYSLETGQTATLRIESNVTK